MAIPNVLLQLARNNPRMQQLKQMMGMVQNAQNPQVLLNQIMQSNPQMQQVMSIVNQYGGDANKAFYETAKQNGIDPQEILNMLK